MIQYALRTKNEHISAYSALGTDALFLYHDICGVAIKISYEQSGTYSLNSQFSTSEYSNDTEVNSTYQNAKSIESNTLNGHIGYKSNLPDETDTNDFYKLTLSSFQLYTFSLTMDSDLQAKLYVVASDGATEIYSDYGRNKEVKLTCPLQSGTYYI